MRVSATMSAGGQKLTVRLGRRHYRIEGSEKTSTIYNAVLRYKANNTEENLRVLESLLNPSSIIADKLSSLPFIEKKGSNYYIVNSPVPIPKSMGEVIIDFVEKGVPVRSIINFWYNSTLNPNKRSRDMFWDYCHKYGVTITDTGYAVLYKAVLRADKSNNLLPLINDQIEGPSAEIIAQEYTNVKRKRRSTKKHTLLLANTQIKVGRKTVKEGEFFSSENPDYYEDDVVAVGNLEELHNKIDEISEEQGPQFTDGYTKTFDIRLGKVVRVRREDCDPDPNRGCSHGLHVGSYDYVSNWGKEVTLACFVNPKDVVCIPNKDTSKIRTCQYLPYGIMERNHEGFWEELEERYWEDDYADYEVKELEEMAANIKNEDEQKVISIRLNTMKALASGEKDPEYQDVDEDTPFLLPESTDK